MWGQCCNVLAKNGLVTPIITGGLNKRKRFSILVNLSLHEMEWNETEQSRAEQSRAEQSRADQSRTEQ